MQRACVFPSDLSLTDRIHLSNRTRVPHSQNECDRPGHRRPLLHPIFPFRSRETNTRVDEQAQAQAQAEAEAEARKRKTSLTQWVCLLIPLPGCRDGVPSAWSRTRERAGWLAGKRWGSGSRETRMPRALGMGQWHDRDNGVLR